MVSFLEYLGLSSIVSLLSFLFVNIQKSIIRYVKDAMRKRYKTTDKGSMNSKVISTRTNEKLHIPNIKSKRK
jgi:hypothetical protein